jgi:hypothetical protein
MCARLQFSAGSYMLRARALRHPFWMWKSMLPGRNVLRDFRFARSCLGFRNPICDEVVNTSTGYAQCQSPCEQINIAEPRFSIRQPECSNLHSHVAWQARIVSVHARSEWIVRCPVFHYDNIPISKREPNIIWIGFDCEVGNDEGGRSGNIHGTSFLLLMLFSVSAPTLPEVPALPHFRFPAQPCSPRAHRDWF